MLRITKTKPLLNVQKIHRFSDQQQSTRCFFSGKEKEKNIEDDGYSHASKPSLWGNIISKFAKMSDHPKPGTLILVRHGESEWNHKKLFTGWVDVDLSERGIVEIEHAARLLMERGYRVDVAYTSMLKRAIRSSWIILNELNQIYRPIIKSWRLNERMYGALEGHSKPNLAKHYGEAQVQRWRAGLLDRPPEMTTDHPYFHGNEAKYVGLDPCNIPLTESLQDTLDRTIPLWNEQILPNLRAGRNVLVVAHRNSLRGIVKHIDNLSMDQIQKMGIPNGIPLVYKFDQQMRPISDKASVAPLSGIWLEKQGQLRAALEKEQELADHIAGFQASSGSVLQNAPSATSPSDSRATAVNNLSATLSSARNGFCQITNNNNAALIRSLSKLKEQRVLFDNHDQTKPFANIDNHSQQGVPDGVQYAYNELSEAETSGGDMLSFSELYHDHKVLADVEQQKEFAAILNSANPATAKRVEDGPSFDESGDDNGFGSSYKAGPNSSGEVHPSRIVNLSGGSITDDIMNKASTAELNSSVDATPCDEEFVSRANATHGHTADVDDVLERPLLVIIRHGKTAHNQLGLFTGWEDAPLTDAGREEALHAGKLFKTHGLKIDVVYTSWLSRAIETAWIVLNELDVLWLPIVKSWRLNERMYGALTGLSKKMIQQIYGDEQFKKWRRGFNEPPPEISSFSSAYPGNDSRYVNYVQDLDVSFFETAIRSLAHGKLEVHRKFPKSESLKNCMERTVPYFQNVIVPESIRPGKNVLISSSENAIRGLLMHLCDIPIDKIHAVEIPTGLPLVFDAKHRRIRLLDDGDSSQNMLEKYNFGANPDLLFKRTKSSASSGSADAVGKEANKESSKEGSSKEEAKEMNLDLSEVLIKLKPAAGSGKHV